MEGEWRRWESEWEGKRGNEMEGEWMRGRVNKREEWMRGMKEGRERKGMEGEWMRGRVNEMEEGRREGEERKGEWMNKAGWELLNIIETLYKKPSRVL